MHVELASIGQHGRVRRMNRITLALALFPASLVSSVACATPDPRPGADDAQIELDRIKALNDAGPMLNAVLVYDRDAAARARELGQSPLQGRTVLVKDNIETREWPTTAGSLALSDNTTGRDAPLIARLRANGGVVLGKTNLSEWANIRERSSSSGWSAVGGLTRDRKSTV